MTGRVRDSAGAREPRDPGASLDSTARPFRLSRALWDIDWAASLPVSLGTDGVTVEDSSFDRASSFVGEHYADLFDENAASPFSTRPGDGAKQRYYDLVGDFFEFRQSGRTIGFLTCTPHDWSTYYLRSAAVLRAHQGRGLVPAFCRRFLFGVLARAGVERVECDTSPANLTMVHVMTRLRFNVTGTHLSERWGAHVRFTKFLNGDCEDTFLNQFCSGVKYQIRGRERSDDNEEEIRSEHVLDPSGNRSGVGGPA